MKEEVIGEKVLKMWSEREELIIKIVGNISTGERVFLVTNKDQDYALLTTDIVIDGAKLIP